MYGDNARYAGRALALLAKHGPLTAAEWAARCGLPEAYLRREIQRPACKLGSVKRASRPDGAISRKHYFRVTEKYPDLPVEEWVWDVLGYGKKPSIRTLDCRADGTQIWLTPSLHRVGAFVTGGCYLESACEQIASRCSGSVDKIEIDWLHGGYARISCLLENAPALVEAVQAQSYEEAL